MFNFMQTELKKRMLTGAAGALVLLGLVFVGGYLGVCLITAVISLGMINEFAQIIYKNEDRELKRYILIGLSWLVSVSGFMFPKSEYELLVLCFLGLFAFFMKTAKGLEPEILLKHFQELQYTIFGLVYLVLLPLFLPRLYIGPQGLHWTIFFLLVVWAGDIAAYFGGKRFGRRKLYPAVSPNKTVEGAVAGLTAGVVAAVAYRLLTPFHASWLGVIITPILVGIFEQTGDFCESFLKRAYGIKDSGKLLPGHGGFLDRFDGIVFSLPVMYACARLFGSM